MTRTHLFIALVACVALGCDSDGGDSNDAGVGDTATSASDTGTGTGADVSASDTAAPGDATGTDASTTAADTAGTDTAGTDTAAGDTAAADTTDEDVVVTPVDGPELGGCVIFPADNPWNQDISALPVRTDSDTLIDSIGRDEFMHPDFGTEWQGAPIGIPYVLVDSTTPRVPVAFQYADESDPGPYPIPPDAPIEGGPDGGGDRHILALDTDACVLWEVFAAYPVNGGESWDAGSGAVFDLSTNDLRPAGWTSADAAGLPILPGLVRYDEVVEKGEIAHALRFTIAQSRRAYVPPATHWASSNDDPDLAAMGMRFRMKASYDCSGYSSEVQVICAALKRYGMYVADNGSDWYLSGAPDPRWSDDNLRDLKSISGDAFEVVDTGAVVTP